MQRRDLRNIAIIAHVDHGKTTLVDGLLRQSGTFRQNEVVAERVLDSGELERERGITILAKNTSVAYRGVKINIVDTPGHADFGGEVERVLSMVDGCLLVVDAFEGPMAQTKFVLRKALAARLAPIVVINKIDRPDARVAEVVDEVLELFIELGADDRQIDFPIVYASARRQIATRDLRQPSGDLEPLFETILAACPPPEGDADGALQLMASSLDYDSYVGRIAIGRIRNGRLRTGQAVSVCRRDGSLERARVAQLYVFQGLRRVPVEAAEAGEIVALAGIESIGLGETVSDPENPAPLPPLVVDEPTIRMAFQTNTSPFAGQEGQFVTSRHLRDRLLREVERNVAIRVEETGSPDVFEVSGRGELQLAILIETMRREGYELAVGRPRVITRLENGQVLEPLELLTVDVPEEFLGMVMELLGQRKGELVDMEHLSGAAITGAAEGVDEAPVGAADEAPEGVTKRRTPGGEASGRGHLRIEFIVPARGLIGFRSEFLTQTKGYGIMHHLFHGYGPYRGDLPGRSRGSMIATEAGEATAYALHNLQERGTMFVAPGTRVYPGMIVGEHSRESDIEVNVCKAKHLTNVRSSTAEQSLRLDPPRLLSLEEAIEFVADDELVEVTPRAVRLRKAILDPVGRERARKRKAEEARA